MYARKRQAGLPAKEQSTAAQLRQEIETRLKLPELSAVARLRYRLALVPAEPESLPKVGMQVLAQEAPEFVADV